jgi:peptide/nickel transport system substrate-binding protein
MRKLRWPLLIALGALLLLLGYLLGGRPTFQPAAQEPVAGGVYREALVGSIVRLNPVLDAFNQVDRDIDRLLYRGLVGYDYRGVIVPELADSWAVSADATLYTFSLRRAARWHDGEPVTADDVIYTFSLLQDPQYPGPADLQALWSEIEIRRLDERTVQFQLPEPFAPFPDYLTMGLLPEHLLRGVSAAELVDHPFHIEPIGTGPFRFERYLMNEGQIAGVRLGRWEDFYGGAPLLEAVALHTFADEAAAFSALRQGQVEGLGDVSRSLLPRVLEDPQLALYSARRPSFAVVFLNVNHPEKTFLADKRLRQALLLAINRQWIIDSILQGQAVMASGPILPGSWAHSPSVPTYPYDPFRAAQMLDQLDWKLPPGAMPGSPEYVRRQEDTPLAITLNFAAQGDHPAIAQAIAENWRAVGIQVELQPIQPADLVPEVLVPRGFEAALTDLLLGPFPDPDPYPFWHDTQAETGQNYSGFSDRNIGIWLEKARITPAISTRQELYKSFQHRFQDQLPALILYAPIYNFAINAHIGGVSLGPIYDPSDRFQSITRWYFLAPTAPEIEAAGQQE